MLQFDVTNVPLLDKNLVEASAGTGKTYSIAILVLRMIVEKNISIDKQLIVTFTNFAVAELQERIRLFIKQAYDIALRTEEEDARLLMNDDEIIRSVCNNFPDKYELQERLRASLLLMDEASILTIHGFCQQMLSEFAFETKQNFRATLQNDVSEFIEQVSDQFWRRELSTLPVGLFEPQELFRIKNNLVTILRKALSHVFFKVNKDAKDEDKYSVRVGDVITANEKLAAKEKELKLLLQTDLENVTADINSNRYSANAFGPEIGNTEVFFQTVKALFVAGEEAGYYTKFRSVFWEMLREYAALHQERAAVQGLLEHHLYHLGLKHYLPMLKENIHAANVLTFDSMILDMHRIIVTEQNEKLVRLIRQKYPVAFIDEFQDTDSVQFELFQKLFIEESQGNNDDEEAAVADTVLFLIGDPKQSIYAFRNADVESYLHAARQVKNRYTMNTNFRSSEKMIAAANYFFGSSGVGTFGYTDMDELKIEYQNVSAHHRNKNIFRQNSVETDTLLFSASSNVEEAKAALVDTLCSLLDPVNNYRIDDGKGDLRTIYPKDIAILVRGKDAGVELKAALNKRNVPAVNIDEATILKSKEAKDLSLILQAFIKPSIQNIRSALYLSFLHQIYIQQERTLLPLLDLDEIGMTGLFTSYHQLSVEQSVYQALLKLFSDFSVQQNLSENFATQRSLANLLQLTELLHQQQYRKDLSAEELWLWLKQAINNNAVQGDQYMQQIESDEDAVNILTIHKSKGLEFPIVLVYGMHSAPNIGRSDLLELKDNKGRRILKFRSELDSDEQNRSLKKAAQEDSRLLYVAITRAVYRCYIFYGKNGFSKSVLSGLLQPLSSTNGIDLNFERPESEGGILPPLSEKKTVQAIRIPLSKAVQSRSEWNLLSYSALAIKHEYEPKRNSRALTEYDNFIFNLLPRGADAGTMLHEIFEKIDFEKDHTDATKWKYFEQRSFTQFNRKEGKKEIDHSEDIVQLVRHVMQADIIVDENSFRLDQVSYDKRLNELSFNFPITQKDVQHRLWPLLAKYRTGIQERYDSLSGMMTGFIDLLFEHNGRYYILDWKSNYLGFELEDYQGERLQAAMQHNQYILQYLIYTLAVHKFLKQRLGTAYNYEEHFGGVIYIFLRGARAGTASGIFTDRPDFGFITALEAAMGPAASTAPDLV